MFLKKTCEFSSKDCYFTNLKVLSKLWKTGQSRQRNISRVFGKAIQTWFPLPKCQQSSRFRHNRRVSNEKHPHAPKTNDGKISIENTKEKNNFPNKVKEALMFPVSKNLNPRSIYDKVQEFLTIAKEKQVHVFFFVNLGNDQSSICHNFYK